MKTLPPLFSVAGIAANREASAKIKSLRNVKSASAGKDKKKPSKAKRKKNLRKKLTLMKRFLVGAIADLENFHDITVKLLEELNRG